MQMSKTKKIKIISLLVLTLGVVFLVTVLKSKNCYSDHIFPILTEIPFVDFIVYYNFLPKDYYSPLVECSLDQGDVIGNFKCKYKGRYQMRIKNIKGCSSWEGSGVLASGQIQFGNGSSNFIFHSSGTRRFACKEGFNYQYTHFFVPKDVPLNTEVRIKITFSGDIENLLETNPDAVFELAKCFDKQVV